MTRRTQKAIGVVLLLGAAAVGFGGRLAGVPVRSNLRALLVAPPEAPQPPKSPEQVHAEQLEVMRRVAYSAVFFVPLMITNMQPPPQ